MPVTLFLGVKMTIAITTKIENVGEEQRMQIASLYKTFNQDTITTKAPVTLAASGTIDLDLTDSKFLVIVLDKYGTENEILDLTLSDGVNELTITNLGFYKSGVFNLTSATILNNSSEDVNIYIIY